MKTNFQMLKELLEKYQQQKRGVISATESKLIKETLHLTEMDILALRNLRDFTVAFLSNKINNTAEDWDKMSAITYVIDGELLDRGREIQ